MEAFLGINGFGRKGRAVFRAVLEGPRRVRVVAINDPNVGPAYAAYLLKHDTVLRGVSVSVEVRREGIMVDGHLIACFQKSDAGRIPWGDANVTHVIECSGVCSSVERATAHLQSGCSRVIVGTANTDAPLFMVDVNDDTLKPATRILGTGCGAGLALAPFLIALHGGVGVDSCTFVSMQPASNDQATRDGTNPRDWLAGRSADNIVPTPTIAIRTLQKLLPPDIAHRVTGHSYRVPVAAGHMLDVTVRTEKPITPDIVRSIWESSAQRFRKYATVATEPIVGADASRYDTLCVFDALSVQAVNEHSVQFRLWFDDEVGYARHVALLIHERLLVPAA